MFDDVVKIVQRAAWFAKIYPSKVPTKISIEISRIIANPSIHDAKIAMWI